MNPEPAAVSFSRYFYAGVVFRISLTILVMGLASGGVALGRAAGGSWTPFLLGVAGLVLGLALTRPARRRWDPLDRVPSGTVATSDR